MSVLRHRENPFGLQSAKNQLERQTAALLAERRALEGNYNSRAERELIRPILSEIAGVTPVAQHERQTEEVVARLQEIIRLCREEGGLSNQEMREVVKVENEVLRYLQKTGAQQERPVKTLLSPQQPGKPDQDRPKSVLSEDTLEAIAEIERKALGEIIHLQRERDQLREERDRLLAELSRGQVNGSKVGAGEGERLREQNRLLREENHALQVRLSVVGHGGALGRSELTHENLAHNQIDSQIAVYENELLRAGAVINELRARLRGVAGLEDLHEQGERIRRETAELLSYKARDQGEDQVLLRELQQRLEQEEQGKAKFMEELKAFKQRFLELEEENRELKRARGSYEPPRSGTPEIASARGGNKKRSGVTDYESTLKELRQALR